MQFKHFQKLFITSLLIACNSYCDSCKIALADGFVQKKGEGIAILSLFLQTYNSVDATGMFDKSKQVLQAQYAGYFEYGLTRRITIGAKTLAIDNSFSKHSSFFEKRTAHSFGLDTAQVFGRFAILLRENWNLSFSSIIQTPSVYKKNEVSYYGLKCWQYEESIELGISPNQWNFITFNLSYHENYKHWYDEVRFNFVWGHYWIPEIMTMIQFQKYIYVIKNQATAQWAYQNVNMSIFDFLSKSGFAKITLSIVVSISDKARLELGFYSSIKSKITMTQKLNIDMRGGYASVWFEF